MKTTIILYYNYKNISDPEALMIQQRELCKSLNLTGRIIIAEDSSVIQNLTRKILSIQNYEIVSVKNGIGYSQMVSE